MVSVADKETRDYKEKGVKERNPKIVTTGLNSELFAGLNKKTYLLMRVLYNLSS